MCGSTSRSLWPCGLTRGSAAAHWLGLRVRIPPVAWISVCCECCVLSARGLCDGLITRPEESYRLWCVWVWSWSLDSEEALAQWGICIMAGGGGGGVECMRVWAGYTSIWSWKVGAHNRQQVFWLREQILVCQETVGSIELITVSIVHNLKFTGLSV